MGNPGHLPAFLQMQEEERPCHRGSYGVPHGQGIPGCFGNIFCSVLILVSAEDAQTQCADHLLHFTAALLHFLGSKYFLSCSSQESLDFMGVKRSSFFLLSYSFSLFD